MPYIGVSPQFGVRRKHTYTATAGQTSFSGAGSEGATLSYTDSNFVDVYQNGVKLGDADYTSTSGTAIVLAQGASVDDLVEIIVFDAFSAADTVSKADGGTFDGNVTMAGTLTASGAFTSQGIDDNADATAITIDSSENVGIGGTPNNFGGMTTSLEIKGTSDVELSLHATSDSMSDGDRIGQIVFNAGSDSTVPTVSAIKGMVSGTDENKGHLSFHTRNTDTGGLPSERMRIDNEGNLLVGGTSDTGFQIVSTALGNNGCLDCISSATNGYYALRIDMHANNNYAQLFRQGGSVVGTILISSGSTSYNTSSDYRLKENVSYDFDATSRLKQLKPCRFNFKIDADKTKDGFLAHEVSSIVPEAISGEKDAVDADGNIDPQGIDQSKLVPLLVKTIQELEARITALESK